MYKSLDGYTFPAHQGLNSRSCTTCSRRKIRCNKREPCSNCSKANVDCSFPPPGRAPRKPQKAAEGNLHERLRRLERVIQTLSNSRRAGENPKAAAGAGVQDASGPDVDHVADRFGSLIVTDDQSRYVSPGMWSHLNDEVDDLKDLLHREPDDRSSPETWNMSSDQAFIFSLSSSNVDISALHPRPETVRSYWDIFKQTFDPVIKVLHVPTQEPQIVENATHLHSLSRPAECLMFAIYYSAITNLSPEQCESQFGPKADLLERYRFGVQQALARAKFLQTSSFSILQALTIFLIALRSNQEDSGLLGVMGSVAIRIGQRLGLHRDGSHYENLSPFKQEMRRRLWWHTVMLDARALEDRTFDPRIYDFMADTKFPSNLNDADLTVDMKELPESKIGCTDMTLNLVLFEIAATMRTLHFIPPSTNRHDQFRPGDKAKIIEELRSRLEDRYLKNADLSVPLYWLIAKSTRHMLSKIFLTHNLLSSPNPSSEAKDALFINAIEAVEFAQSYATNGSGAKYGWMRPPHASWHDIVLLLKELCVRQTGPDVERAWCAIRKATEGLSEKMAQSDGHLWKRVERLMVKAEASRLKAETDQQKHLSSEPTFTQGANEPPVHDGLRGFAAGAIQNPLHAHVAQNGTPEFLQEGSTPYLLNPDVPAAEDVMFIGGDPLSQSQGYSGVEYGVQEAPPTLCSATPAFNNPLIDPFSSLGVINHGADSDSLDWVMQDDVAHHLVSQRGLVDRDSDGYPNALGEWANYL